MTTARIRIWPELQGAVIAPAIYGHFAEHLGRCVYEGIWVGEASRIPNERGLRLDVLAALKQLRAPVVRWPGGCFADDYHWKDGIGPRAQRPRTLNLWWQQGEPNEFGTDEFMLFCRALGCAPYVCLNVGSGTPEEARAWVEYCNFSGDSTLTAQRAANGAREPYSVPYWGIGNESWGCGGRFSAEDYAREYKRFASFLWPLDPRGERIACGTCVDPANPILARWNHDFCNAMPHSDLIDHLSIHCYCKRGGGADFSDSEYTALFGDLLTLEREIQQTDRLLAYFYPDKKVGLVIDEWGVWHPEATVENGLEQPCTLRDAVFAGATLNLFNRNAHRITMANMAQAINVLQCLALTDGPRMALTPTYHVFDMMRPHMGARLLTIETESPECEVHPVGLHRKYAMPLLSTSVSISAKKVFLTVANQSPTESVEATIDLRGTAVTQVSARVLTADSPRVCNTFDEPKAVVPKRIKIEPREGTVTHVFTPHSFTALSLTLA